jgi:hypothetical protein
MRSGRRADHTIYMHWRQRCTMTVAISGSLWPRMRNDAIDAVSDHSGDDPKISLDPALIRLLLARTTYAR